jgi:hypothetical protein
LLKKGEMNMKDFKPTDEMKLKAWEFMKKHALPRMREAEKNKKNAS